MKQKAKSIEESADRELRKSQRRFRRKKRETILIRIQKKWRSPLKEKAREKKKTLSKLHDEIYPQYLNQN